MTATPISDEAMIHSEPHGYEVVPYCVAMALEVENAALRRKIATLEDFLRPSFSPPVEPKEVYSPYTEVKTIE